MKLFKWQRGRQAQCRYWKYPMWFFKIWKFGFNGYILAYPKGALLPEHTDKVNGKMWRLNINLKGKSVFTKRPMFSGHRLWMSRTGTFNFFRPDITPHSLSVHTRTYKLSLGFAIFK